MENKIEFRSSQDNTWVMRITQDKRIEVNEDVEVTEAAKLVLASMQNLLSQQRTWVEITKGECDQLFRASSDHIEYAFAIEKRIKELNT